MKKFTHVFFDLDGTLTNPAMGITNSVEYALNKFGIQVENKEDLFKFIGPPLNNSFIEFYGFDKEQAIEAVRIYREYFSSKGIYENEVYDDIVEILTSLKKADKKIVLATSKPQKFAIEILHHFKLYDLFDLIFGASMDEKLCEKEDIIRCALKEIPKDSNAIMVGDRKFDIIGAKFNNIKSKNLT